MWSCVWQLFIKEFDDDDDDDDGGAPSAAYCATLSRPTFGITSDFHVKTSSDNHRAYTQYMTNHGAAWGNV